MRFQMLEIDALVLNPDAIRRVDELQDLRLLNNLGTNGVRKAFYVSHSGDGFLVLDGNRRLVAMQTLQAIVRNLTGLPFALKVPCEIAD